MELLFCVLALVIIGASVGVVAMPNPLYSAFCLILALLGVAGVFAMLDAHFLAVVQIVVYAGAIMVLFVFVIMLLNVKEERLNSGYMWFGGCTAAIMAALLFSALASRMPDDLPLARSVGGVCAGTVGDARSVGACLYSKYVFPFEAASMLIMAALVGAVLLGKRTYRSPREKLN